MYPNKNSQSILQSPVKEIDGSNSLMLKLEAEKVYNLYEGDYIREIYFNEKSEAVLIMECPG